MMIFCKLNLKRRVVLALGYLFLVVAVTQATGNLIDSDSSTPHGIVLNFTLNTEKGPTSAPTTAAPSVSQSPTQTPTVSLTPSVNPTESPAPSPSPSDVPTMAPSVTDSPTRAPSTNPTESPAPSPSPSDVPTERPSGSPSAFPTPVPTVSPMPSRQPSDTPSEFPSSSPSYAPSSKPSVSSEPSSMPSPSPTPAPSAMPSDSPSSAPTISAAPSRTPSQNPTPYPSSTPSVFPSDNPSSTPSAHPSAKPSQSPSSAPSISMAPSSPQPSAAPSSTPTEESFKTKTGNTHVFLPDIESELTNSALAEFEVVTLQFIKDTLSSTPGYTIEMLAVTVLNQKVVQPALAGNTSSAVAGLQVGFRTVGVVTDGVAPRDFNFTDITDNGFNTFFGEFLYRLSAADSFFVPLSSHIDTTTLIPLPELSQQQQHEQPKKGQYVAAVLFATTALAIALAATVYAVRKHMRNETTKIQQLEYPGFGTRTMSDEPETRDEEDPAVHQEDDVLSDLSATLTPQGKTQTERVGIDSMPLQLNIDDEKIEMEDIGLTPISMPPAYRTSFSSAPRPPRAPVSPSAMERGDEETGTFIDLKRSSFGRPFGMKKWLTPRRNSPKNKSTIEFNDPPDSEIMFEGSAKKPKNGRTSMDPDAAKASTQNLAGILSDEQSNFDCQSKSKGKNPTSMFTGNTPLGIPVSFFGRTGDTRSDATSNNLDSMIGSTASSFFTKMAGRKSNVFTGRKSIQSDIGNTKTDMNSYRLEATQPNKDEFALNPQNLATLQTNSNDNVEATIPDNMSDFEKTRSRFEGAQKNSEPAISTHETKPNIQPNATEGRDDRPMMKLREPMQRRSVDVDSVYSEQSELDLNELGIETTLGALPPQYGNDTPMSRDSFVGHEYGSRPNGADATSKKFPFVASAKVPDIAKPTTKARNILGDEEKRRMSLNTAIKQGDTYDVFAPPGPIGIVVDTSKQGPAVHSLKSTSPMLGLINPGDLIIALDDEDTRTMTAASLTRLMAKKSRQKERKITLLAPDGF